MFFKLHLCQRDTPYNTQVQVSHLVLERKYLYQIISCFNDYFNKVSQMPMYK